MEEKHRSVSGLGSAHLGVALKGAHMASYHRSIFLAITESLFQAHVDRVTGIFVSTI